MTGSNATGTPNLTAGQRSTIAGLSSEPCVLGCAEPIAIALCKPNTRRVALVQEGPRDAETGLRTFALTAAGLLAKDTPQ